MLKHTLPHSLHVLASESSCWNQTLKSLKAKLVSPFFASFAFLNSSNVRFVWNSSRRGSTTFTFFGDTGFDFISKNLFFDFGPLLYLLGEFISRGGSPFSFSLHSSKVLDSYFSRALPPKLLPATGSSHLTELA